MQKNSSCLFDIEMENDISAGSKQQPTDLLDTQTVIEELKRFLLPSSQVQDKLQKDIQKHLQDLTSASSASTSLNPHLTSLGYFVHVRKAEGDGNNCLKNLRHTFLSVFYPGLDKSQLIVDLQFKDQFIIAKPTDRYSSLLACISPVLVIPEEHIAPLVTFLCAEMSSAFKTSNTVIPPWRQASSMLTKWQPQSVVELGSNSKSRSSKDQCPVVAASPASKVYGGFGTYGALGHFDTT